MANNQEASRTRILAGGPHTSTLVDAISTDVQAFLGNFSGRLTFQTFDDAPGKSPSLNRILHNPTVEQLAALNAQGAGIFVMVNEGDGQGRKTENVVRVRAFCADFDGANLPVEWPLEPSLIVETSPGKFHAYWFLAAGNDVLLSNDAWNAQQKQIARIVGSQENDCTGLNRVMRVPGFLHLKNPTEPFLSHIITSNGLRYDLADIQAAFPVPQTHSSEPQPPQKKPQTSQSPGSRPSTQAETQRKYALRAMRDECASLAATPEGDRNNTLNGTAFRVGRLVGGGHLDPDEARNALLDAARASGMPDNRIIPTLNSGYQSGIEEPDLLEHVGTRTGQRRQSHAVSAPGGLNAGKKVGSASGGLVEEMTAKTVQEEKNPPSVQDILDQMPDKPQLGDYRDLVLAQMRENADHYRYHQTWRNWWRYKNGVYVEVTDEKMGQTADRILQDHGYIVKNNMVTEVLIKLSRETDIGSVATDQGSWELNTKNGILDLKTGDFRTHTPDYYSIIQSAATYEPGKTAPLWEKFITEAVPDAADRELLQMYAGLCLTGDTSPQKALFLIGEGGTGKGTFTRVLSAVLGDLATSSAIENIKDGSFGLSELVGKRMCVVSEMPKYVDWLPFKRITGEDRITVDVKYKSAYTTKLDIKLIVLSNIMPTLGDDAANSSLTRRFLPISFDVCPAERDPQLENRLTTPEELAGILNWMLTGLTMLRERGMQFPASTNSLSREIVEASNHVIPFLRDRCTYAVDATVTATEIYEAYRLWGAENGTKPLSAIQFPKYLLAAGRHYGKTIHKTRRKQGMVYVNLILTSGGGGWEEE